MPASRTLCFAYVEPYNLEFLSYRRRNDSAEAPHSSQPNTAQLHRLRGNCTKSTRITGDIHIFISESGCYKTIPLSDKPLVVAMRSGLHDRLARKLKLGSNRGLGSATLQPSWREYENLEVTNWYLSNGTGVSPFSATTSHLSGSGSLSNGVRADVEASHPLVGGTTSSTHRYAAEAPDLESFIPSSPSGRTITTRASPFCLAKATVFLNQNP